LLAQAELNILTLSVADSSQFGVLRLVMRDWGQAINLLEKYGFAVKVVDLVAIQVVDQPGGIVKVLDVVEKAGVTVEYVYAVPKNRPGHTVILFCFNDPDTAILVLQKKNFKILSLEELLPAPMP